MKNKGLVKLRVDHDLTQPQAAEKLGVSTTTYNLIENCKRRGSVEFWQRVQTEFNLDGEEMWKIQNRIYDC